jgi:protoporphyrinogen oxidase
MSELIIIGAGITGLSAGYHAEKRNIKYQIFEQESQVGGLCRTLYKDGFYFDISGHVLSLKDQYIQALVRRFLKDNLRIIKRNAAIYSKEVFTRYPFQVNLYGLPRRVISECLREFV